MKPLAIIKKFFGITGVQEMKTAIAGFSRPLEEDANFRWIVTEAAREIGCADILWTSA